MLGRSTRRPWSVTRGIIPSIDKAERVIVEAAHRSTEQCGYAVANCGPVGEYGSDNDAQLIVCAVGALPALLDALEAVERERDEAIRERDGALKGEAESLMREAATKQALDAPSDVGGGT